MFLVRLHPAAAYPSSYQNHRALVLGPTRRRGGRFFMVDWLDGGETTTASRVLVLPHFVFASCFFSICYLTSICHAGVSQHASNSFPCCTIADFPPMSIFKIYKGPYWAACVPNDIHNFRNHDGLFDPGWSSGVLVEVPACIEIKTLIC